MRFRETTSNRWRRAVPIVALSWLVALPVHAQSTGSLVIAADTQPGELALRQRAARLEAVLQDLSAMERSQWTAGAISNLAFGALMVGFGTWEAFRERRERDDNDRVLLTTFGWVFGGGLLAIGAYALVANSTTGQERFARWKQDRAAPRLSPWSLARYEGELAAEAAVERQRRTVTGVVAIGAAAAGAALLVFAATDDFSDGARGLAYTEGAAMIVLGVWHGIASLSGEGGIERAWRLYQAGTRSAAAAQTRLSPALVPGGLQLRATGRF